MPRRLLLMCSAMALTPTLLVPGMASAAPPDQDPGAPANTTLTKVSGISALAGGTWTAGCRIAVTNVFGNELYHFIIWQTFTSNGTKITSLPAQTTSSGSDLGWSLTSSSSSHRWNNLAHTSASATGNYTFTQYVAGQPYRTASGWVRVTVSYKGTWTCSSS
jgi:hypothetical protein